MPTTLTGDSNTAVEGSTFVVNIAPTDEDGNAVTPITGAWTLTEENGDVINGRKDVAIDSLSTSMDIVLSGDDLPGGNQQERTLVLTFEGTYNSSLGSGLPLNDEVRFTLVSLVGVK